MIALTRSYDFAAAHVLARPDWSEERNRSVYGKCANPGGHGHNYVLQVTVSGELDPATGLLVQPQRLDGVVRERVLLALDGRFLNREVAEFSVQVPTAENIARWAWNALKGELAPARLVRIRLQETGKNSVEYAGEPEDA